MLEGGKNNASLPKTQLALICELKVFCSPYTSKEHASWARHAKKSTTCNFCASSPTSSAVAFFPNYRMKPVPHITRSHKYLVPITYHSDSERSSIIASSVRNFDTGQPLYRMRHGIVKTRSSRETPAPPGLPPPFCFATFLRYTPS